MSYLNLKVTAKTHWVWTDKAEKTNIDPSRTKAGEPVWPYYLEQAPARWLEEGLIKDASEIEIAGQLDLFDII